MMFAPVTRWHAVLGLTVLVLLAGGAGGYAHAQERDPTVAPAEAGTAAPGATPQGPWGTDGMAVVVRDGKPFLVVDTRLYAPGQKVGSSRIERITETEIWLRDGTVLRKVPRFAGIERRNVAVAPLASASAPRAKTGKARKPITKAKAP